MKKLILLFSLFLLFGNLSFAKMNSNNSVTRYKSGSYKVTTGNRTDTYDKYGKKKSTFIEDSLGNKTTITYDKNGNKIKTTIKSSDGSSKTYDKNGKLIKSKKVTDY